MNFDDIFADIFPKKETIPKAPKPNPCPDMKTILEDLLTYIPEKDEHTPEVNGDINPMPFLTPTGLSSESSSLTPEEDVEQRHHFDPFDFLSNRKNRPFKGKKVTKKKKKKRGSIFPMDPDFDEEAFQEEYGEFLIGGKKNKSKKDRPEEDTDIDFDDLGDLEEELEELDQTEPKEGPAKWEEQSSGDVPLNVEDITREKIEELRNRVAHGDLHLRSELAHALTLFTSDPLQKITPEEIRQMLDEALELLVTLMDEGKLEVRFSYVKVLLSKAAWLVTAQEPPVPLAPINEAIAYIKDMSDGVTDREETQFLLALAYRIQSVYYVRNDLPSASLTPLLESEKIWQELAASGNLEYLSSQAGIWADIADTMVMIGDNKSAAEYYRKSADAWRDLEDDDETALPECVNALNRLAQCLKHENRLNDSLEAVNEALEIERRLAKENPGRYTSGLIQLLDAKCEFYYKTSGYGEIIKIQQEISDSYERLQSSQKNPITVETCRTRGELTRKRGIACQGAEQYKKAHNYFHEAMAWVWQLKTLFAVDVRHMTMAIAFDESSTLMSEGYYTEAYEITTRIFRLVSTMTTGATKSQYPIIYPHILRHYAKLCEKLNRIEEAGNLYDQYFGYWKSIVVDEGYIEWIQSVVEATNDRVEFALHHGGDLTRALKDACYSRKINEDLLVDSSLGNNDNYDTSVRNHALVLEALGRNEEAKEAIRTGLQTLLNYICKGNWGRLHEYAELGTTLIGLYDCETEENDILAVCDQLLTDIKVMFTAYEHFDLNLDDYFDDDDDEEDKDDWDDYLNDDMDMEDEVDSEHQGEIDNALKEMFSSNKDLFKKFFDAKAAQDKDSELNELEDIEKELQNISPPDEKKKNQPVEDPYAKQKNIIINGLFEEAQTRIRCARLDYKEDEKEIPSLLKSLESLIDQSLFMALRNNTEQCDSLYFYICEYVKIQMMAMKPQAGIDKLDNIVHDMRYQKTYERNHHFHEKFCAFFELLTHLLEHGEGILSGDLDDAYDMYFSYCRMGQEDGNMIAMYNLCRISLNRVFWLELKNRIPEARRILSSSLPVLKKCIAAQYPGAELLNAKTLSCLARFQNDKGETALAAQNAEAAMKVFRQQETEGDNLELKQYCGDTLRLLGDVYRKRREPDRSIDCYHKAIDLYLELAERGKHDETRLIAAEIRFKAALLYLVDPDAASISAALDELDLGWDTYLQVPETYRIETIKRTLEQWSELLHEAIHTGKESIMARVAKMIDSCCEKFTPEIPSEKLAFVIELEMTVAGAYVTTGRLDEGIRVLDHVKNFSDRARKEFTDHDAVDNLFFVQCACDVLEVWVQCERRDYSAAQTVAARLRPEMEFRLDTLRKELRTDYTEETDAWYHTLLGHYINLRMNGAVALLESGKAKEALAEFDTLRDLAFSMLDSQVDIFLSYAKIQSNRSDTLRRLHQPERAVSTADVAVDVLEASPQRGTPLVDGLLAEVLRFRAIAKWHAGDLTAAIDDAQKSVELLKKHYDNGARFVAAELGRSLFVRGRLLYADKQVTPANADLNRGIALFRERVELGQRHILKQLKEYIPY